MSRSRGSIFIAALGITVVLSGMLLVFAQSMRTEVIAGGNRIAALHADAVVQGAEQWVLAQVEGNAGDASEIVDIPAEQLELGGGYFWVIRADPQRTDTWSFGIADEAGKVNPNNGRGRDLMLRLPGVTEEVADSIGDWVDDNENVRNNGAESSYYGSLIEPYRAKNERLETVEELLLVKGMTPELLYGNDTNRDGVIDAAEQAAGGRGSAYTGDDGRGIYPFITVHSIEPNTSSSGGQRLNINSGNPGQARTNLSNLLRNVFTQENGLNPSRAGTVMSRLGVAYSRRPYFPNLLALYTDSGMTKDEFKVVFDRVTTSNARNLRGMVNINTAPLQVLATLPGLEESDADALVQARSSRDTDSIAWILDVLTVEQAVDAASALTSRSYQYSADIVAVSGDGRAFKRVKIVVDCRNTPAQIIYRKDLTNLGWPLDPQIRHALRTGQPLGRRMQAVAMGVH